MPTTGNALRGSEKISGTGQFVPSVKRQIVPAPGTRAGLPPRDALAIRRAVPVVSPALLPKLENEMRVRVDDETRARLDQVLLRRARSGLRLTFADLVREAVLRYLDKEEAKFRPKSDKEAA